MVEVSSLLSIWVKHFWANTNNYVNFELIVGFEVMIALVVLVGPQGSVGAVIDPQTWWKFRGQEKGSVIKTWDRLLSSSIRNDFGHRTEKGCCSYLYLCERL